MFFTAGFPKWLIYFELSLYDKNIYIKDSFSDNEYIRFFLQNEQTSVNIEIKKQNNDELFIFEKTKKFYIKYLYLSKINISQLEIINNVTEIFKKIEKKIPDSFSFPKFSRNNYKNIKIYLREKNILDYSPNEDSVLNYYWYYNTTDIRMNCIRPWVNIEMMDVRSKRFSCCNPQWLKIPFINSGKKDLLGVWNSKYFKKFRKSIIKDKIESVCHAYCYNLQKRKSENNEIHKRYIDGINDEYIKNRIINLLEIVNKKIILESKPIEFSLSPSMNCNYNCIMCPNLYSRKNQKNKELEKSFYEELKTILPFLSIIHVSGQGEPFASEEFLNFILKTNWSKYPDISFSITTNGSLLSPNMISLLYKVPIKYLIFSINSMDRATYKYITGKDKLNSVLNNIDYLLKNKINFFNNNFDLQISSVIMKSNYKEIENFIMYIKKYKISLRFLPIEIGVNNPQSVAESFITKDNHKYYFELLDDLNNLIKKYNNDDVVLQNLISLKKSLQEQFNNKDDIIKSYTISQTLNSFKKIYSKEM